MRKLAILGVAVLLATLAFAEEVKITKGPVVEHASGNSAVVAWSTNVSSSTVVKYGTDQNNLSQTAQAPWGSLTHRVTLKNLEPGKTYYYQVDSVQGQGAAGNAMSQVESFTTEGGTPSAANTNGDNRFRITNGPVLERVGDTNALIAWSTNLPSSAVVKYGPNPSSLNQTAEQPWGQTTHRVELKNLQPGTRYYFSVHSAQGKNAPGQSAEAGPMPFTTAQAGQSASVERH